MGITPQELRDILRKTEPAAHTQGGGFVAAIFGKGDRSPRKFTSRQYRAMWNGAKIK